MKKLILIACLVGMCTQPCAQSSKLEGAWYGVGYVVTQQNNSDYLTEFIIDHLDTSLHSFQGQWNYYFKNMLFRNKLNGQYIPSSSTLLFAVPSIISNGATQIQGPFCDSMQAQFFFYNHPPNRSLSGALRSPKKGCPSIRIRFSESSAYELYPTDSSFKSGNSKTDTDKKKSSTPNNLSSENYSTNQLPTQPNTEDNLKQDSTVNESFKQRKMAIENPHTWLIEADSIEVVLYDNGVEDGDMVSLYYDQQAIGYNIVLTKEGYKKMIYITEGVHVVSLFAMNLGAFPPNTALMIIKADKQRYQTLLSSDFSKNAAILIQKRRNTSQ